MQKRKCIHCGAPASGSMRVAGSDSAYCRDHLPAHRQRFNQVCLGALLRGAQKRRAKLTAARPA